MSEADNELKRDLECLRLASDFIQLSRDTLDPELRAHCALMARYWTEMAEGKATDDPTGPDKLDDSHA